jgi:hypothetical protein
MTLSDRARAMIRDGHSTAAIAAATGLRVTSVNRLRRRLSLAAPRGRTPMPVPADALAACLAGESARSTAARFNLTAAVLMRACRNAGIDLPKRRPPVRAKKISSEALTSEGE